MFIGSSVRLNLSRINFGGHYALRQSIASYQLKRVAEMVSPRSDRTITDSWFGSEVILVVF
jgi:hypothetical protein